MTYKQVQRSMVIELARYMPPLGEESFIFYSNLNSLSKGMHLGLDSSFSYLKSENLLVKPKRSYTNSSFSKHCVPPG